MNRLSHKRKLRRLKERYTCIQTIGEKFSTIRNARDKLHHSLTEPHQECCLVHRAGSSDERAMLWFGRWGRLQLVNERATERARIAGVGQWPAQNSSERQRRRLRRTTVELVATSRLLLSTSRNPHSVPLSMHLTDPLLYTTLCCSIICITFILCIFITLCTV